GADVFAGAEPVVRRIRRRMGTERSADGRTRTGTGKGWAGDVEFPVDAEREAAAGKIFPARGAGIRRGAVDDFERCIVAAALWRGCAGDRQAHTDEWEFVHRGGRDACEFPDYFSRRIERAVRDGRVHP